MTAPSFSSPPHAPRRDEDAGLSLPALAHACCMSTEWVAARVQAGLLSGQRSGEDWWFGAASLQRARRLARLEATFDADPELAALTVDLIEEVAQLRLRLRRWEAD